MKPRIILLALPVLGTLLAAPVFAQPPAGTDYDLQPGSRFSEGCLEPCLCPIWTAEALRGGFSLYSSPMEGSFHVFQVLDLEWEFTRGPGTSTATGTGTYRVDPDALLQRLELDLRIDQDLVVHFDSGLGSVEEKSPSIGIAVAMNGFYCWDQVFEIIASPSPVIPAPETSWGTLKARYD